ncbi:MAG: Cof-type HAD-IIB family hydrolase [Erysipelotrichaceae bacterium]|nr:Cof-type HAD-IIB family hydrolase [Erysipelotrichaceae bacterium]MDD3924772.1 Cof-type HAD-IIB family hydrolase [Erysipelotrichaceae bacterium]MDD4643287.1 Cof-type HAD-IIB family hydrolase [Erysipelotrichaceae bacterium]
MYRLVACDLDQTLLSDDRSVSLVNVKAITKLKELGIKFVIATGRGYQSVQDVLSELMMKEALDEYVISLNGAIITENHQNRLLALTTIEMDVIDKLFAYGISKHVDMHIYTQDNVFVLNLDQEDREYLNKRIDYQPINEEQLSAVKNHKIAKIIFHYNSEAERLAIVEDIKPITDGKIAVSFSSNRYIELNHLDVNKGKGLAKLADFLNIPLSQTIAIGDNFNDLSMIKSAGLGVCVSNALNDIKEIADYVCEADNNHDAISEVLTKFVFNK